MQQYKNYDDDDDDTQDATLPCGLLFVGSVHMVFIPTQRESHLDFL
jgi:hypothetical protein